MKYNTIINKTMSVVLSYDQFMSISYSVDRTTVKFPDETRKKFEAIKRKLGVKDTKMERMETLAITKIVKQPGKLRDLFKLLNKVTDKTYEKLKDEIISIIMTAENASEVCDNFFKIVNTNSVHCHLYAKLYNAVIQKEPKYKNTLRAKTTEYMRTFDNVNFVSSNEDYDAYCLYIKHIGSIKNFTLFLVKCVNENVLELSDVGAIIQCFQENILSNISNSEESYKNETYTSNIHTLIKEMHLQIRTSTEWGVILSNHQKIISISGEGKTKKMTFNLMDTSDIINKN